MSYNTESSTREYDQDINVDLSRTVQRAAKDYPGKLHQAIIREWIQNSTDGWCTNTHVRGVLNNDPKPPLQIEWNLDTDDKRVVLKDNAGGMPRDVFKNKFLGINTPGEEKEDGGQGGSEGRGFYVMANTVDKDYGKVSAETIHKKGTCRTIGVDINTGKMSGMETKKDSDSVLDNMGTAIIIPQMKSEIFEKLRDPDFFRNSVLRWFWNLFNNYKVTASLVVDGETMAEVDDCPFEFRNNSLVSGIDNFDRFTSRGKSGRVDSLEVHRRDSIDTSSIPFDGAFCLMKGNEHLEEPYMTIKEYKPQMISAVNKKKVLGYADVSSLCPQFEKRNHKGLHEGVCSLSGLRKEIASVCEDEFNIRDSAEDVAGMEGAVIDLVNDVCKGTEVSDSVDDEYVQKSDDNDLNEPELRLSKERPNHDHMVGDRLTLVSEILEVDESRTWLLESLEVTVEDEVVHRLEDFGNVETEPDSCEKNEIHSFSPDKEEKYRITLTASTIGKGPTVSKEASLSVYVGDSKPNWTPTTTTGTDDKDKENKNVINQFDIDTYPTSPEEAIVRKTDDGLVAKVNISHPRLSRIDNHHSKDQAKKEQLIEFSCAVLEAIKTYQIREHADDNPAEVLDFIDSIDIEIQRLRKQVTEKVMNNE